MSEIENDRTARKRAFPNRSADAEESAGELDLNAVSFGTQVDPRRIAEIVQSPSADDLDAISALGLPVTYIPAEPYIEFSPIVEADGTVVSANPSGMPLYDYYQSLIDEDPAEERAVQGFFQVHVVMKSAIEKIAQDFGSQLGEDECIGLRGVTVSVRGELPMRNGEPARESRVLSLEKVLRTGSELPDSDQTAVIVVGAEKLQDGVGIRTSRSAQWLVQGCNDVRAALLNDADAEKVFPALLVYDLKHLTPGKRYQVNLPEDVAARANVIRRIYIMDYIRTPEEVRLVQLGMSRPSEGAEQ